MFALIWMLITGLIVGALAKLITPGPYPGGIFTTMLLGVAGSFVAGLAGRLLGMYGPGQSAGFLMSILGAILLLAVYLFVMRRHSSV
jgi:uncharacterized membrane protein YeaQ/YmgE (transglycosylase-associated protein family)